MGKVSKPNLSTAKYLEHLKNHPEILANAPSCTSEGAVWLKRMLTNQCPAGKAVREMRAIMYRWEKYHLNQAASLGFQIDIEDFKRIKGGPFGQFS